jgi:cytochrome c oxidase subunit 4
MSSITDPTPLHAQANPPPEPVAAHGDHEEHGLAHISPWQTLVKVWAALMVLTILTVMATWVDLGAINIFIALGIAVVKATLVVMYFMHMKYDKPFNCYIFMFSFAFVAFFLGMAMLDSKQYSPTIERRRLDTEKAKFEPPPPPPATGDSGAKPAAGVAPAAPTPPAKH